MSDAAEDSARALRAAVALLKAGGEVTAAEEKLWLQGYATAMANVLRWTHDYSTAQKVMRSDNVSLEMLEAAGAMPCDLDRIRGTR